VIRFDKIVKSYPRQIGERQENRALNGVSFSLQQGETLGLIGQNGAGKSTSIRLLLDFIRPDHGRIELLGATPDEPALRRKIGYLPEIATFPHGLTCMEWLRFAGRCNELTSDEIATRSEHWLQRLGLWDTRNRLLRSYSKGMKQRASFAAALLHDPDLLILDEPMSGLDPLGRADIIELIGELRSAGKSILFCSHLLDDVERLTDHVAVLHRGNILFHGNIAELCYQAGSSTSLQDAFIRLIKESKA